MKELGLKTRKGLTAEEFWELCHDGKPVRRELVRGEVREMPPAGGEHGSSTGIIHGEIYLFTKNKKLGRVFAAETGFIIERGPDTVRAPDVAFIRADRLSGPVPKKFPAIPPDLAVETVAESDTPREVQDKVAQWLQAGVRLVWVIDPGSRTAAIHRSGREPIILKDGDFLDGEDVLPGFRLAVTQLWA